jgi:hypothetical protein
MENVKQLSGTTMTIWKTCEEGGYKKYSRERVNTEIRRLFIRGLKRTASYRSCT